MILPTQFTVLSLVNHCDIITQQQTVVVFINIVVRHFVEPGGHRSSKFKLQCGDIWLEALFGEYQVVILIICPILGYFLER